MPASYPSSIKSYSTKVDGAGNIIFAAHVNELQDEVTAVETGMLSGFAHVVRPDSTAGNRDLGTSTALWRDVYVGTSVRIGTGIVATGESLRFANATGIAWRNAGNTGNLALRVNASDQFTFDGGSIVALTDNNADVGTSVLRWRDVFVSSSVRIGTNPATAGAVRIANNTEIQGRNAANSADVRMFALSTSDRVQIAPGGADIQWGGTLIALGGGAAPTVGTIGGSGPATAAQNAWMRVVDSTGAAFWVPIWK